MENINRRYIFLFIISVISTIILTLGFFNNKWGIANQEWFDNYQIDSEMLVVNRLENSKQNGILNDAALLTFSFDNEANSSVIYSGQIGLQGIVFSIIDKYIDNDLNKMIKLFHLLISLFNALILTGIILWAYLEFGIITYCTLLITTTISQWITVFGRNLYWVIGLSFLPFLVVAFMLYIQSEKKKNLNCILYISIFLILFIKSACGYEYISTVLISMEIPVIYYAIKDKWNLKEAATKFLLIGLAGVCGFMVAIIINAWQIGLTQGGIKNGFDAILYNVEKRTVGDPSKVDPIYAESLSANVSIVLQRYFNDGYIFDFSNIVTRTKTLGFYRVTYKEIIEVYTIFIGMIVIYNKYTKGTVIYSRKGVAIFIAMIISILAPLSWFILAKGHSYIHTHINFILWHIPFTLVGFIFIGNSMDCIAREIVSKIKKFNYWR